MRTVSQTLNQLNIYHRESGKEVAKKSPPKVGTDLKDWPQRLSLQRDDC